MRNIAILASGSGTNAENIIKYFSNKNNGKVNLVLSNRADAYVLKRAEAHNIPAILFDRNDFYTTGKVLRDLVEYKTDLIVLAGFLWHVPEPVLKAFERRIINIHPALLPKYGGKGMYGERVHRSIIGNHEQESGITIHYVNEEYDAGDIIFQARCRVEKSDTPETLACRIHALEYEHYPRVIEDLINKMT